MSQAIKKLTTIVIISIMITKAFSKAYLVALAIKSYTLFFKHVVCIYYLLWLKKNQVKTWALIKSSLYCQPIFKSPAN